MFDVVQKAHKYCGDLEAEIRKVDEFLDFAERLIKMDNSENYSVPVESIAGATPLCRLVEVAAPPAVGKIKTESLFRGAFSPIRREYDAI